MSYKRRPPATMRDLVRAAHESGCTLRVRFERPPMIERPIIFSGPMVRAILDGKKTQTRRPVKATLPDNAAELFCGPMWNLRCPYGDPGDRLWVKETFTVSASDGDFPDLVYRADRAARQYRSVDTLAPVSEICYFASNWEPRDGVKWHPSIYMSRDMSRITLEVTGVRVERVQEISIDDLRREGVLSHEEEQKCRASFTGANCKHKFWGGRWDAIYAKRFPYASNPWVWVVEFRRIP